MFEEKHYALFQPLVDYIDLPTLASLCCSCKTLNIMLKDEQIFVQVLIKRHMKNCFTRLVNSDDNESLFLRLMDTLGINGMVENGKITFNQEEIRDSALHAAIDGNFRKAFDILPEFL